MMQEAWMEAFGWDEQWSDRFKMEWKRCFEELGELGAVRISPCLKEDKKLRDVTIHTFSDASERLVLQHLTFAMSMKMEQLAQG